MKIEVIAKKNHSYQFSNIILYVIISSFLFVFSRKIEKFFKIVCCSPSEHIFLRNDFDSAFYQGWFVLYTHVNYICTYTIYTGGTAFSARKTPAIAMPETSCASAVFYPFHLFSLFLVRSLLSLSFSFYLYPTPRTFENRYSKIIFRRFFEQYSTMRYQN